MLVQAGFADPVMDQEQITRTWPDAGALLMELRGLGANVAPGRHAGLRTPRWRDQLLAALQQQAREARPALTIELVYGHAFRVAARPRIEAQTNVSLDAMREMVRGARP
jgi:malonyl-CoA O-methyltransferase